MRKVSPGLVCIVLGVVLLLAAGGLYAYNRYEDAHAGAEAQTVVADLQQKVETPEPEAESGPLDPELPVVEIDGNEYVGEISIPAIGIDLPVMSEWSYPRLKIAPCRQFGSSAPMIWSLRRTTTRAISASWPPSQRGTASPSPIWTAS